MVRVNLTSYDRQLAGLVFERRSKALFPLQQPVRLTEEERENLLVSLQAVMRVCDQLEETAEPHQKMIPGPSGKRKA